MRVPLAIGYNAKSLIMLLKICLTVSLHVCKDTRYSVACAWNFKYITQHWGQGILIVSTHENYLHIGHKRTFYGKGWWTPLLSCFPSAPSSTKDTNDTWLFPWISYIYILMSACVFLFNGIFSEPSLFIAPLRCHARDVFVVWKENGAKLPN